MGIKDLIITPVYIILFTMIAYFIRPYVTNKHTRKYFLPALWVRFAGAIALGLIYQFYYGGGDTFMYFNMGTSWIWNAFLDSPLQAFQLIFGPNELNQELFQYHSRIYTYGDNASFFVVRFAGLMSILSGNTYGAIALGFAFWSFLGTWLMYKVFVDLFPSFYKSFAYGILFLPSLFFWGSGLLKDSITLGALGFLFFACYQIIEKRQYVLLNSLIIISMFAMLKLVKIYILLAFLPALVYWVYSKFKRYIKPAALRYLLTPVLLSAFFGLLFFTSSTLSQESRRYSYERVFVTAEETAKWNYYVSEKQGGSGYTLGDYDFSPSGLVKKFVPAVLTAVFRPSLIEARNPMMLITAIENTVFLIFFFRILWRRKGKVSRNVYLNTFIFFVILFSFAVGVTTYNFGTLARYRIPMLPFLMVWLMVNLKAKRRS